MKPSLTQLDEEGYLVAFFVELPEYMPLAGQTYYIPFTERFLSVPDTVAGRIEHAMRTRPNDDLVPPGLPSNAAFAFVRFWEIDKSESVAKSVDRAIQMASSIIPGGLSFPGHPVNEYEPSADPLAERCIISMIVTPALSIGSEEEGLVESPIWQATLKGRLFAKASDPLTRALLRAFFVLSKLVDAYRLTTSEPISSLTWERLPMVVPMLLRSLDEGAPWSSEMSAVVPHLRGKHLRPERTPSPELMRRGLYEALLLDSGGHLIYRVRQHMADANVATFRNGDYGQAIIQLHLASEILLDGLLLHLLWEEGTSIENAACEFAGGLSRRIRICYANRLGGNWGISSTGPIGKWHDHVPRLRGRVVHGGYKPDEPSVMGARENVESLIQFCLDQLSRSWSKYPRSCLLILGPDELMRRTSGKARIGGDIEVNDVISTGIR